MYLYWIHSENEFGFGSVNYLVAFFPLKGTEKLREEGEE